MGRRQGSEQRVMDPTVDSPSDIERRIALLEGTRAKVRQPPPRDPFDEDELQPLERIQFVTQQIDPDVVRRLAAIGCDDDEIGEVFAMTGAKIRQQFEEPLRVGRAQGKTALRRKQWQVAMKGNVPMLIHLGKNVLGQNETINHNHNGKIEIEHLDAKQQLMEMIREAASRIRSLDPANEVPMPRLVSPESDSV